MIQQAESVKLFKRACDIFPGGVNSPVRAFKSVKSSPFVVERGKGPYLWDVDGNRYIDYVGSWGPLVLGHAHERVLEALNEQLLRGTTYGACSVRELELGELVQRLMPSMEMIRFVNSGTEAGMSVVRLARAFTGRDLIVKFNGCYHGHADSLLVKAGSGVATYGLPDSPGVIKGAAEATISVPYNNIDIVADVFDRYGDKIAAVILEPVVGNSGLIIPISGFLESLRAVTAKFGSLLIFDEVMTGFRVHKGGAQALYGVVPDLTMLGKVIGGGLPVGAFGGRAEIMQMLAPIGPVYQAGTLSGNPLAMVAGRVTLEEWCLNGGFEVASKALSVLIENFRQIARENGVMLQVESIGSMFGYFFASEAVRCFEDAIRLSDKEMFRNFYLAVLERGVFFAPSPFEAGFISSEHNEAVLDETVSALKLALKSVADIYGSNK